MKPWHRMLFGILTLTIALSATIVLSSGCSEPKRDASSDRYFPELGNYADLYLRASYDLLHMMKVRELDKIGEACKIATRRKMAGGLIVSGIGTPHIMYGGACAEDVPGNPNIAPDKKGLNTGYPGEPELDGNDFLIAANPTPHVEKAFNNGCYVLGVGFPMITNRYSPSDFNDHPNDFIEKMSNTFIYTWGPKEDGIVTPALTPVLHLKILPTSPMTVVAYWTIMAQLAHNLAYKDTSGSHDDAAAYLDILMGRLNEFHSRYIGDVQTAGDIIAEKVLAGGKIYPWSSRDEFFIESNGTAGGLMGVYPLDPDSLTAKDVVIFAAADSTPAKEIEVLRKCREKGAWIAGIFPFTRDDDYSMDELKQLCDMSFDNLSGDVYGVMDIPGYSTKIIPTTTMMNNYAFWAIVGGYVQAMESSGEAPYYWMSYHVPGGKEYDESIRPLFLQRGY